MSSRSRSRSDLSFQNKELKDFNNRDCVNFAIYFEFSQFAEVIREEGVDGQFLRKYSKKIIRDKFMMHHSVRCGDHEQLDLLLFVFEQWHQ